MIRRSFALSLAALALATLAGCNSSEPREPVRVSVTHSGHAYNCKYFRPTFTQRGRYADCERID